MKNRFNRTLLISALLLPSGFTHAAASSYNYVPTETGEISVIDTITGEVKTTLPTKVGIFPDGSNPIDSPLDSFTEGYVLFEGEENEISVLTDNVNFFVMKPQTKKIVSIFTDFLDGFHSIRGVFFLRIIRRGNGSGTTFTPRKFYRSGECSDAYCEERYLVNKCPEPPCEQEGGESVNEEDKSVDNIVVSAIPDSNSKIIDLSCDVVGKEGDDFVIECVATFDLISTCQDRTYPVLPNNAIDINGNMTNTQAEFVGGISTDEPKDEGVYNSSDFVSICGIMTVEPTHEGQTADIVVLASYAPLEQADKTFYMRNGESGIELWNGVITNLLAFKNNVFLNSTQPVDIYSGKLPEGAWGMHFGYRLKSGKLIFNTEPIRFQITP